MRLLWGEKERRDHFKNFFFLIMKVTHAYRDNLENAENYKKEKKDHNMVCGEKSRVKRKCFYNGKGEKGNFWKGSRRILPFRDL